MTSQRSQKSVESFIHEEASRRYIPTAELEPVMQTEDQSPIRVAYERRNRDLNPQLVWRGKDEQDWSDLVVSAPPLFVQEKIHPKYLIDDLRLHPPVSRSSNTSLSPREGERAGDRGVAPGSGAPAEGTARSQSGGAPEPGTPAEGTARSQSGPAPERGTQLDLFADFNGLPEGADRTDFYQHDAHWSNRMILGDSLQVMASLAEREGLRGQVQCIYLDPPYGIKFNSNFQWSTTSRDVRDGNPEHITREPEQVKAFRDTWRDGIHSYLTYLRDRLTVARDLLTDSGSIFVQIGDENVHRVRALMDEVFGESNCIAQIQFSKTSSASSELLPGVADYILWYARNRDAARYRPLLRWKKPGEEGATKYDFVEEANGNRRLMTAEERLDATALPKGARVFTDDQLTSQRPPGSDPFTFQSQTFVPVTGYWKTSVEGLTRLAQSNRVVLAGRRVRYIRYLSDFPVFGLNNIWTDTGSVQSR